MASGKHFKSDKDVENKMEVEEIEISTSNDNEDKENEEVLEKEKSKKSKKEKKEKKEKKDKKARKEERKREKEEKRKSKKKKSIGFKILMTILILLFIGSLVFVGYVLYDRYKNNKEEDALKTFIGNETNESENTVVQEDDGRMGKVKELQKTNKDVKGWLEIEGTDISYPLLQGKDNDYYVHHTWKKKYSIDGSIFLDKAYDWSKPSSNLLIYGHNNRGTKTMFVNLLKFKKEDYYKKHKYIRLTTEKEDAKFEIIGAFKSRVYYKSEKNVFRYYYFVDAKNKEEFDDYVKNVKKASLYKTDATAEYGDQLMTLSTCDFSQEDGRFVVVAKKITDGSTTQANSTDSNVQIQN